MARTNLSSNINKKKIKCPLYRHPLWIFFVFLFKTIAALSTVDTDRNGYVLHSSKGILCCINH